MYLGRIIEQGPARDVVRNPQHPYTKALLSVVPKRDPRDRATPQILQGETPNPIDIPPGCRFAPRCPLVVERCTAEDPSLHVPVADPAGATTPAGTTASAKTPSAGASAEAGTSAEAAVSAHEAACLLV